MVLSLTTRKKVLFAAFMIVVVPALAELALALFGLDPILDLEDPYVGFQSSIPLFQEDRTHGVPVVYRTSPTHLGWFNEQAFPVEKARGTYRIFCMGGSTTFGRPYNDATSFAGWLRLFLAGADSRRNWEVINCGGISYASYRVAATMEELIRYEPDLFIIYTGHNEFLERRTYGDLIDEHPVVTSINLLLYRSRIVGLMRSVVRSFRRDPRAEAKKRYELTGEVNALLDSSAGLDLYHRDDALRRRIINHYAFNLRRMVLLARSVGARVLFVNPAANIKDCSPFKSEHRADITESERAEWQTLFDRGFEALRRGSTDAAVESLRAAARLDERHAATHYELGRALFAEERAADARAAWERALDEDVCPLRVIADLSEALTKVAKRQRVGLIDFAKVLRERCRVDHGHDLPGAEYFLDHVHPTIAANRLLAELIMDHLIGEGLVEPGADWNDDKADRIAVELEASLDHRDHARARVALARVLQWAGKQEEADRLITSAAGDIGDEAKFIVTHAGLLERQGKLDEARREYDRALQLEPGIREAYVSLGRLLVRLGRMEEAIERYRQAIHISPDFAIAYQRLGEALSKTERYSEAIEQFAQALRLNPTHSGSHAGVGEALLKQGRTEAALEALTEALRVDPRSPKAHMLMGMALVRVGRAATALGHYRSALEADPTNAEGHFNLGTALVRQGDLDAAIHHFQQAVDIRPEFTDARFNLGMALLQRKKPEQAARHLERVLADVPGDAAACYNLALIHASGDRFAEAIDVLRRGVAVSPDDIQLMERLAWLLAACPEPSLRNPPKAVALAERINELTGFQRTDCLETLATAYAAAGRFTDAAATTRKALERATGNVPLTRHLRERLDRYADRVTHP